MQTIINIIVFLLILGSIITIHELGHFLAAKFFGVYCDQFSIGFGPKIWSKKGKETEYELRLLPFGGFVAMAGEEDQLENENMKDVPIERTLKGIKTYKKVIIFLAGVFMNFVLGISVLFMVNVFMGEINVNVAQIGTIAEGSAAETYQLQVGDIIQKIDVEETGQTFLISQYNDIILDKTTIKTDLDTITLNVTVERNNEIKIIPMKVNYKDSNKIYEIGITPARRSMTFLEACQYTWLNFVEMAVAVFTALSQLVTHFTKTVTQLSGPAGIYQVTAEITESGQISYIFSLLALLSINVGVFNLMPIPGLDGCQVLFAVVEGIIGNELPQKLKLTLQMIGLGLVLLLMAFVTCQDILRIMG